jgi:ribosome-associated heat shock protein Hsp15
MILLQSFQHLELLKLSKQHYRKNGTEDLLQKRYRRDIDEFGNEIKKDEED